MKSKLGPFDRLVRAYQGWPPVRRAVATATITVLWVALGAIFVPGIAGGLTDKEGEVRIGTLLVTLLVLAAVIVVVAALQYAVNVAQARINEAESAELVALRQTDQPVLRCTERLEVVIAAGAAAAPCYVPHEPTILMQELVDSAWDLLHNRYGESSSRDRIEFEVAFMPLSYLDGEVTIAAFASNAGRSAPSMAARATNPQLFRQTETFKMFANKATSMHIISDTAKPDTHYAEIRPGQRQHIRSTVLQPVLARGDELVATLVLSCDRPEFFAHDDVKTWRSIAEPFARRLALEKLRIDRWLQPEQSGGPIRGMTTPPPPY